MNKNAPRAICIIAVLVTALVSCATPSEPFTAPTQFPDNEDLITASWAVDFTLDQLIWGADLIVEGTVAGIQETRLEHQIENTFAGEIYTDYKVDVSRVLKAYPGFTGKSVVVRHRGGTHQGRTQVVLEDEPYRAGEKVLLFLRDLSVFPGLTRPGEMKYSVMMPGGRFQLKPDGKLDTPTKNLAVAETYRGKDQSALEKDVLARLPTPLDYLQRDVETTFLIVEGKVGPVQKTWMSMEDVTPEQLAVSKARGQLPELVYTFYTFAVDKVLHDELVRAQGYKPKTGLYKGSPVKVGDVITVVETGGTYEGITQRETLIPFLKPGDKMFLFLGGIGCGDRLSICTQAEQDVNKILYTIGGPRFLLGADNRLGATSFGSTSRTYTGQPAGKLEQDIAAAKAKYEKALEEKQRQPTPKPLAFPTPLLPTAAPRP